MWSISGAKVFRRSIHGGMDHACSSFFRLPLDPLQHQGALLRRPSSGCNLQVTPLEFKSWVDIFGAFVQEEFADGYEEAAAPLMLILDHHCRVARAYHNFGAAQGHCRPTWCQSCCDNCENCLGCACLSGFLVCPAIPFRVFCQHANPATVNSHRTWSILVSTHSQMLLFSLMKTCASHLHSSQSCVRLEHA